MPKKRTKSKIVPSPKTQRENKILLTFLKQTKEGKYAVVEKNSMKYARWSHQVESIPGEEDYYYGLS